MQSNSLSSLSDIYKTTPLSFEKDGVANTPLKYATPSKIIKVPQ